MWRTQRVEDHVGVGQVLLAAAHAELELVAREGEGRGAVAVRGVTQEIGQGRHAQVHDLGLVDLGFLLVDQGLNDGVELVAQEDRDDCRGRLVGAKAVVVARGGNRGAQQVSVLVNGRHERGEKHQELEVLARDRTRLEQVLAVGADRPVVVLARAVHVLEGLLVLQAGQAVTRGHELELLHGEEVVVDCQRTLLEDRGKLVLGRGDLVVLGLDRHAELPELVIDFLHEVVHRGSDGAEVVLLELLALDRLAAKERAPAVDQVGASLVVLLLDEEVLLLGTDGGEDALGLAAEEGEHALGLRLERNLGAQKRRLLVQRLTGVGDEGRGDAEDLVLDEGRARGVPGCVAAGLEGGAQAAAREGGGVRLALDELLAREGHEDRAVVDGREEAVVLLGRDARERLEPVREVRGALLERPLLHRVRDLVGDVKIERLAVVDDLAKFLVRWLGEPLLHHGVREEQAAVLLGDPVLAHVRPFSWRCGLRSNTLRAHCFTAVALA